MQQSRFIQGNLQAVFDALFFLGAIDPMLQANWQEVRGEINNFNHKLNRSIDVVNQCKGNTSSLVTALKTLDETEIKILTMEVGRELAEFADRQSLH